eukprot:c26127_g1_i1 orf=1-615(+)
MQELMRRNSSLTKELVHAGGKSSTSTENINSGEANNHILFQVPREPFVSRAEVELLRQQLEEYQHRIKSSTEEREKSEVEIFYYRQLAAKHEADLKSLSDAYNSLEQYNYQLELELRNLQSAAQDKSIAEIQGHLEAAREEGRQEAQKENEAELNDLLVCLGQEESKVEKLKARLIELGENVEALIETIGDGGEGGGDEEENTY